MPRGVDYKIPLRDLLQAARDHEAGWSLRFIARSSWRHWGYASAGSALEGLRHALRTIDAPVRGRIAATVEASTMHGNARRAMRAPDSNGHTRNLAHRSRCGKRRRLERKAAAELVACPACPAGPGEACVYHQRSRGERPWPHPARYALAERGGA